MSKKYRYFAIVDNERGVERPIAVVREWDTEGGFTDEEAFTRNLKWEKSDTLARIRTGRDYEEAELVGEDVVEKFKESMARRLRGSE